MYPTIIPLSSQQLNQTVVLSLAPDDTAIRVTVNLRWHEEPARWFLTVADSATSEVLLNSIPLVASSTVINDLLTPFRHKLPGTLFCVANTPLPDTTEPDKNTLFQFDLIWMDRQGEEET